MRGFSLIELMVAVVVAGILAAVAYPAYTNYVTKSRREDARTTLAAMVQAQERIRSNEPSYSGDAARLIGSAASAPTVSAKGYYTMSVANASASGYEVHAVPVQGGPQAGDTQCKDMFVEAVAGNLRYRDDVTQAGAVSPCWPQ